MGLTTFETGIGVCKLVWQGEHVQSLQIGVPHQSSDVMPNWVKDIVKKLQRHLSGKLQKFSSCPLNLEAIPKFHRVVYRELCQVPHGATISYAELAKRSGSPRAARAVGQAMARNPFPILIPCHRVLAASGQLGHYSGGKGAATKRELLLIEGVQV